MNVPDGNVSIGFGLRTSTSLATTGSTRSFRAARSVRDLADHWVATRCRPRRVSPCSLSTTEGVAFSRSNVSTSEKSLLPPVGAAVRNAQHTDMFTSCTRDRPWPMLRTVPSRLGRAPYREIAMVVQRLSIRADFGKLKVIAVWQCLAKNGMKVCRWRVEVDRTTRMESMTVDVIGAHPMRIADLAAMLGDPHLEMRVAPFHLTVISNPGAEPASGAGGARDAVGPFARVRSGPRLTLAGDVTDHVTCSRRK